MRSCWIFEVIDSIAAIPASRYSACLLWMPDGQLVHERRIMDPPYWEIRAVTEATQRRLTVVMMVDVVGYSRMMEADEEATLAELKLRRRSILQPVVGNHGGRIVKLMGDGALVEFASAVNAVSAALEIQRKMNEANERQPEALQILLRIGINLGDVIGEGADIYGDGVNIAARLQSLSRPGGVCISGKVLDEVRGKLELKQEDMGEVSLKNISRPVRVFHISKPEPVWRKSAGLALPDKPSIAVLPFQNMSGDIEQEYFGDGIAEDIITALSRLRGFFVISRNSSFAYKGKAVDIRQIARDLGVRYVLEGSVRKSGDRLRVTSQLIDASSDVHVWSERYDRGVSDIFAVQDEITESVVGSIEPQLHAAEKSRSEGSANVDAWGYVMQAMPYVWSWAVQDNQKSVELLKKALEADPNYGRASSLLAWAYAARAQLGWSDASEELEKALTMTRRAIEQDVEDPWSHLCAGYVHMVSRRFKPAVEELNQALELNPSFAFPHMILGSAYGYAGESDEGLRQVALAQRLSPRDYNQAANYSTIGLCHLMAERFDEAEAFLWRAVQLRPHFGTAWRSLTAAAGLAGHFDVAAEALAQIKQLQPNVSLAWVEKYHPIVHRQHRAMYIEGLRQAGLE
jgi:adenylate cyclase